MKLRGPFAFAFSTRGVPPSGWVLVRDLAVIDEQDGLGMVEPTGFAPSNVSLIVTYVDGTKLSGVELVLPRARHH